ncbi:MAG TPA: hypothetical protein VGM62_10790 [Chthoniobacterales bacterium]
MSDQRLGLRVAGSLFALFALVHVFRMAVQLEVRIGGQTIPMWASVVFAVVAGGLSIWFWSLSKTGAGP